MLDVNGCTRTDLDQKKSLSALISGNYGLSRTFSYISMVPKAGLEPAHLSMVDFESTASTDFATSARRVMRKTLGIIPLPANCASLNHQPVRQVLKKSPYAVLFWRQQNRGCPPAPAPTRLNHSSNTAQTQLKQDLNAQQTRVKHNKANLAAGLVDSAIR